MKKFINYKLIVLFILVFSSYQLQAQNEWDGDNAIGRFTFCDNWFANTCPATWNSTTDLIIQLKNNGAQTTMFLDYGAWRDINNLIYSATYTSSVTQFDADGPFLGENGLNFYGKIENNVFNRIILKLRTRFGTIMIPTFETKPMISNAKIKSEMERINNIDSAM